ncbi:MAG: SPOR domain-containing protein, partial [Undibacterium sp.]|nr:SPOR domain-containing protein [Undibacterium sp.]
MSVNNMRRQYGNTLTGIIIGLVIGLSIAVVVAFVINKASTPFTNKNGKSDKPDAPVTQMQDPNKPLYGSKDAAIQAAKEVAISKAQEASKVAELKANPASTAIVASVAASAPVAPVAEDKNIYFLQIGAFKEAADAENARAKLALVGMDASVTEKTTDAGTLHRVRVGPL